MSFQGTIKMQPYFNVAVAVEGLYKAMKGMGCDKRKVLELIVNINNAQRQQLRQHYQMKYQKDLLHELKSELHGDFEDVILGLMEPPAKYDAQQLQKAMKGFGTREGILIDILCGRTNSEISAIKNEYQIEFGKFLETDIIGDTSGDFQTLLISLINAKRDYTYSVNQNKAIEDAKRLKETGDKELFREIFTTQNFAQLHRMCSEYEAVNGETIQSTIQRVFHGDAKDAYSHMVECIIDRVQLCAKILHDAMKAHGVGTKDATLIRIIISRSEIDLENIKTEFQRMYNDSVINWVKGDTHGAYKDALIAILNGN